MNRGSKGLLLLSCQWLAAVQQVATRTLRSGNILQTTSVENADRIRRPGSRKVQTRTHFCQVVLLTLWNQELVLSKTTRIMTLA